MSHVILGTLIAFGIFVGVLACMEVGRRIGRRRVERDPEHGREGLGTVEAAVFGLLGLMIAFTFTGAASRFDSRRAQIAVEANAIGTAWLRLDTLPAESQPALRARFRDYTDARIGLFRSVGNDSAMKEQFARLERLQGEIWPLAVKACHASETPIIINLVVPAINDMFDQATMRNAMARIHPPTIIFIMLAVLTLLCSFLAGYAMAGARFRNFSHVLVFALIISTAFYVIIDLEFPRVGLIRLDAADAVMTDLRASMK